MIHAGKMNAAIELYRREPAKNAAGESVATDVLYDTRMAERNDAPGSEIEDGKAIGLFRRDYGLRFDPELMVNATQFFVRDFDGDFDVVNVILTGSRKRYITLKTVKRGASFTI
jgi:hypothetical protein